MVDQAVAKITPPSDGFDTANDDAGGAVFIKFDAATQNLYFDRAGTPVRREPWFVARIKKEAVRWCDRAIVDRIDESQSPDIDTLNAAIPQDQWEEGFDGEPKAPWSMQFSFYLVNPQDGSHVIFSNSTFGQKAAFGDLKSRVQFMRNLRGENVIPVVKLSSTTMKTRFGTKARPHLEILDWRVFGQQTAPAIAGPSGAPVAPTPVNPVPGKPIEKPTASEIIGDEIDDRSPPKKSKPIGVVREKPRAALNPDTPPFDDTLPLIVTFRSAVPPNGGAASRSAMHGASGFRRTTAVRKYQVEFHGPAYLKVFVEANSWDEAEDKGWTALKRGNYEVAVVTNDEGVVDGLIDCDGAFPLREDGSVDVDEHWNDQPAA